MPIIKFTVNGHMFEISKKIYDTYFIMSDISTYSRVFKDIDSYDIDAQCEVVPSITAIVDALENHHRELIDPFSGASYSVKNVKHVFDTHKIRSNNCVSFDVVTEFLDKYTKDPKGVACIISPTLKNMFDCLDARHYNCGPGDRLVDAINIFNRSIVQVFKYEAGEGILSVVESGDAPFHLKHIPDTTSPIKVYNEYSKVKRMFYMMLKYIFLEPEEIYTGHGMADDYLCHYLDVNEIFDPVKWGRNSGFTIPTEEEVAQKIKECNEI